MYTGIPEVDAVGATINDALAANGAPALVPA
jgi:hypothetical protein